MEQEVKGQKISVVTVISEHEKSGVYLATDEFQNLVILKRVAGEEKAETYRRIQALHASCFPEVRSIETKNGETFVTEEYVEGRTLDKILEAEVSVQDGLDYCRQLLLAIGRLHQMDPPVIHRDVKPENVLITKDGELKLLDFDAARSWAETGKEKDTALLGTRGYAAPEQFGYSQTDERSDVYSAGIVCKLIAEKMPMDRSMEKSMKAVYDRATMFDPKERFQSIGEMLAALDRVRRKPWKGVLFGGALAALVLFGVVCVSLGIPGKTGRETPAENGAGQGETENPPENVENPNIADGSLPEKITAWDLDVLPEEYSYRIIGSRVRRAADYLREELQRLEAFPLPSDEEGADGFFSEGQECAIGTERVLLRFLKAYPQAILFADCECEFGNLSEVRLVRYSANGGKVMEHVKLVAGVDVQLDEGLICVKAESLQRLKPGIYELTIGVHAKSDVEHGFYLQVHGEEEKVDGFAVRATAPVQYYSKTAENAVFFYIYNTPWPVERLYCDGKEVPDEKYVLTVDGRGVVLQKDFFEDVQSSPELTFEMKNGRKAYGRVILIP